MPNNIERADGSGVVTGAVTTTRGPRLTTGWPAELLSSRYEKKIVPTGKPEAPLKVDSVIGPIEVPLVLKAPKVNAKAL
jgi:hypothetical protein